MFELGFGWSRVTVAEVEGEQHRRVSLAEWLGLALVFGVPATTFLTPENGTVSLTERLDGVDADHISLILNVGTIDTTDEVASLLARRHDVAARVERAEREIMDRQLAKAELEALTTSLDKQITELSALKKTKKALSKGAAGAPGGSPPARPRKRGARA